MMMRVKPGEQAAIAMSKTALIEFLQASGGWSIGAIAHIGALALIMSCTTGVVSSDNSEKRRPSTGDDAVAERAKESRADKPRSSHPHYAWASDASCWQQAKKNHNRAREQGKTGLSEIHLAGIYARCLRKNAPRASEQSLKILAGNIATIYPRYEWATDGPCWKKVEKQRRSEFVSSANNASFPDFKIHEGRMRETYINCVEKQLAKSSQDGLERAERKRSREVEIENHQRVPDMASTPGRTSECQVALEDFLKASEYAGLWRLGDLERVVLSKCRGDEKASSQVKEWLASVSKSLTKPCRSSQAALDNSWYRDMKQGEQALNGQGQGRQRRAIEKLEANCPKQTVTAAQAQWTRVFEILEERRVKVAEADASRLARLDLKRQQEAERLARINRTLAVADLVQVFDKLDSKKLKRLLAEFRGPRVPLDNGSRAAKDYLAMCLDIVSHYRKERSQCKSASWYDASCKQKLLREGEWRNWTIWSLGDGDTPELQKSKCGFSYEAFNKVVKADVAMVTRYEQRLEVFDKHASAERKKLQALDRQASEIAAKDRALVIASYSGKVCGAYQDLEMLEKHRRKVARVDRVSGTVDLAQKRRHGVNVVVTRDRAKAAIGYYIQAGGKKRYSKKKGTKFWCSQPSYSTLLAVKKQSARKRLVKQGSMSAKKLCAEPDWKEFARAIKMPGFKTCESEDMGGDMTPMPQPHWKWLKEARRTGEHFMYAFDSGEGAQLLVLGFKTGSWKLLRTEYCSYVAGSSCSAPSQFSVQEI